jgi:hypothetical protein
MDGVFAIRCDKFPTATAATVIIAGALLNFFQHRPLCAFLLASLGRKWVEDHLDGRLSRIR